MHLKSAQQTDDRLRNAFAHFSKCAQFRDLCVGDTVEPAINLLKQPAFAQPFRGKPLTDGLGESDLSAA